MGKPHLVLLPRANRGEIASGAAGDVKEVDAVNLPLERRLGRQELARAAERLWRERPGESTDSNDDLSSGIAVLGQVGVRATYADA